MTDPSSGTATDGATAPRPCAHCGRSIARVAVRNVVPGGVVHPACVGAYLTEKRLSSGGRGDYESRLPKHLRGPA